MGVEPNEESHSYAYENANRYGVKSIECVRGFGESLPGRRLGGHGGEHAGDVHGG